MTSLAVDTDVVSFLFKRDSRAALYGPLLDGRTVYLSFMSVAELDRWALQSSWGRERRARMEDFIRQFVQIPSTRQLGVKWAEVMVNAQNRGRRIDVADAWIAATALSYGVPLLTHNRSDYAGVGELQIISFAP